MKVWKRCAAALLTLIMTAASGSISLAAGTMDTDKNVWRSTAAEIVAEHYGLNEKETLILCSEAINNGRNYYLSAPYENTDNEANNLVAVNYLTKKVYAKHIETNGHIWVPAEAVLIAEGEEIERFSLEAGNCTYNNIEYNASNAFTYSGNHYTVQVIYRVTTSIRQAEQERLLAIPSILVQTAKNLETDLKGMRLNLKYFGQMLSSLKELMKLELPVEKIMEETNATEETETVTEPDKTVKKTIIVHEPAFDPVEDAELIAVVDALYAQYMSDPKNPGLTLFKRAEDYRTHSKECIKYTLDNGEALIGECEALYKQLDYLDTNSKLSSVLKKARTEAPELYADLKYFNNYLGDFLGTSRKPGPLVRLMDRNNWKLLDTAVQQSLFRPIYTEEALSGLEALVYALRNEEITVPAVDAAEMTAAQTSVSCEVLFWDVTITVNGTANLGEADAMETVKLPEYTAKVSLPDGASKAEMLEAITATGIEKKALDAWNGAEAGYQVSIANYTRTESGLPAVLKNHLTDYTINYAPRVYSIKTNFAGTYKLPYGAFIELPPHKDKESSYDYVVKDADGKTVSYEQGVEYKVTGDAQITRKEGSAKTTHRLYDILAEDEQYGLDPSISGILSSGALKSPTLNIRVPDPSSVPDVTKNNGVYTLKVKNYYAGIAGMYWQPASVQVMDGDKLVQEVAIKDGAAVWKKEYTHVNITYRLKITRVKDGILNRTLDETEDILYALNLPNELAEYAAEADQLLQGEEGPSAKSIYSKLNSVSVLLSPTILETIKEYMITDDGINAILRLRGSEKEVVRGLDGTSLGTGGWSSASEELALYKYLSQSASSDWSLAVYYTDKLYETIAAQAQLVADCLDAVVKDPGLDVLLNEIGALASGKKEELRALIPELEYLASNMKGPHHALNVKHTEFSLLTEQLLAVKGNTKKYAQSNGVYANTLVQKNSENNGVLTIVVKFGNSTAKRTSLAYPLDTSTKNGRCHILTDAEEDILRADMVQLEETLGLKTEEKKYYDCEKTSIPKAGDMLGTAEKVTLVYTPKKYTVTIHGVPYEEYHEEFYYGSDYCIELPPKSKDRNAPSYYKYIIDGNERKVANGSSMTYSFSKEDLLTLFATGNYEMIREEISTTSGTTGTDKTDTEKEHKKDNEEGSGTAATDKNDSGDTKKTEEDLVSKLEEKDVDIISESDEKQDELEKAIYTLPVVNEVEQRLEQEKESALEGKYNNTAELLDKLVPVLIVLFIAAVSVAAYVFMRRKKRRNRTMNYEGAPLVDYDIGDDD